MDNTYNIFTAERRIDIKKECNRIVKICRVKRFYYPLHLEDEDDYSDLFDDDFYTIDMAYVSEHMQYSLLTIFNNIFENWGYRNTATDFTEYLEDISIQDFNNPTNDTQAILILLTIVNLLDYSERYLKNNILPKFDFYNVNSHVIENLYINSTKVISQNINFVLDKINYKISDYGEDRKIFTKRDADVDSVLGIDIKLDQYLLGYLDIQNQENIQFKKHALKTLADYLEPHKSEFKETSMSSYYDTFAFAVNNMNIRHNNKSQINLGGSEKEVYDKIFRIGIHLIRELDVREIKKEIDQYKPN